MERLTVKWKPKLYDVLDPIDIVDNEYSKINYEKMLVKLGEYEDAEEQGLLLRLPFKIGQKVYYIYESCIDKSLMIGSMIYSYSCLDFPRKYFSTKEEAEQALKQMGE